jgi:hypothetical protein
VAGLHPVPRYGFTVEGMTEQVAVPEQCTLPTVEQPLRMAAIDDLLTTAVRVKQRLDGTRLRLELVPEAAVAARVGALALLESGCCSFFTFTLTATGGTLALEVAVPPAHADVLDAVAGRVMAGARP